ncbi:MAG: hypothetical protein QM811_01290 [Pirellulales bacterium]
MLRMLALLGLSCLAVGCRICDSPYDYCGPVQPCGEMGCASGGCGGGSCGGGCSSCGGGGGHSHHAAMPYEGETIYESAPTRMTPSSKPLRAAPEMAPAEEMPMKQTRRNVPHPASYREEVRATRGYETQSRYEESYAGRGASAYEDNVAARPRTTPKMSRANGPIVW